MNNLSCLCFQHCAPVAPNGTEAHPHAEVQYHPGPDYYGDDAFDDAGGFGADEDTAYRPINEYQ